MAEILGGSTLRKLNTKDSTDKNTSTPLMAPTQNRVFTAFQTIPPTVFAVAPADLENSPSVLCAGIRFMLVLYLFISSRIKELLLFSACGLRLLRRPPPIRYNS